ncbi:PHD finger protein 12 isoform X2 [Stigmatopora argus]
MWDKMETPTIVYDLDTSGGLMEQIQTLLAPPKSEEVDKRSRKMGRDARRSGRATNHDTCDSCREGGDLLCCDHCPAAFHLQCCDPPLSEEMLPPGEWMCHRCNVRKKKREQKSDQTNGLLEKPFAKRACSPAMELEVGAGALRLDGLPPGAGSAGPGLRVAQVRLLDRRSSSRPSSRPGTPTSNSSSTPTPSEEQNDGEEEVAEPEDDIQGIEQESSALSSPIQRLKRPFQLLIAAALERNPTQFQLPSELTCTIALPGSSKRRKREELLGRPYRRPQYELDPNGLVPLPVKVCFSCNRSCRLAPLIQCDYCPLLFHTDCLDPPLTALPTGKWMCPNHVEHLVLNQRNLSLSSRCQLFDEFQDRISQHAVKLDFLRRVHRQFSPNSRTTLQCKKRTIKVPGAIKSQYRNPPSILHPAGVRQLELVCSGVPEHQSAKDLTTEAEQQEWLQDVIALQCSILRHLSTKKNTSALSSQDSDNIAICKSSTTPVDIKTQPSEQIPPKYGDCKPCSPHDDHEWSTSTQDTVPQQVDSNCSKHNGPLPGESHPSEANGPLGCSRESEDCEQTVSQHRLKPCANIPDSVSASDMINHIGTETHKKKPESSKAHILKHLPLPTTACSEANQNHTSKAELLIEYMGNNIKSCVSITSQERDTSNIESSSPTSEIELGKLDIEMIKLLAWQRIQQLFPCKAPSPLPTDINDAPKPPTSIPDYQKKLKARAVFYPLTGKGMAVSMCYRTLYIGSALSHLEHPGNYVRMLFIDYSSAFNTIKPDILTDKLSHLGLSSSICCWIKNFLTNRPQTVRLGPHLSSSITLSTGSPQGCVLSPLLYSLYTYDCTPTHQSNAIIKFADDTTVVGLISGGDESAYRDEVNNLSSWCSVNNLTLNTTKTKEIILDFRKHGTDLAPLLINGVCVDRVQSFKFLGVHVTDKLSWSTNITAVVKKAQKRLHFLRVLRKNNLGTNLLITFYRTTVESILAYCITVWYAGSTAADKKAMQKVINTAQRIVGCSLPSLEDIASPRYLSRARNIIGDPYHPGHNLFQLLPSGRRYRSHKARTNRLKDSFFPTSIRNLNSR